MKNVMKLQVCVRQKSTASLLVQGRISVAKRLDSVRSVVKMLTVQLQVRLVRVGPVSQHLFVTHPVLVGKSVAPRQRLVPIAVKMLIALRQRPARVGPVSPNLHAIQLVLVV